MIDFSVPSGVSALGTGGARLASTGRSVNMPIGQYLGMLHNGAVRAYEHNRGDGKVAPATVKAVANNLNVHSLGTITVSQSGRIADGHGRSMGLHQRYSLGNLTASEQSALITVKTIPDEQFQAVYKESNSGKAHTSGNKLSNPEYGFRQILDSKVGPLLKSPHLLDTINASQRVSVAYSTYGISVLPRSEINFGTLFGLRLEVKRRLDLPEDEQDFKVGPNEARLLAEALDFYGDLVAELGEPQFKSIRGSGPFMLLILADRLLERPRLPIVRNLARRIRGKILDLHDLVSALTHGSEASIHRTHALVLKALGVR